MDTQTTALITGASSGIGAVYADRLARRGYDLVLVARDERRLKATASRISDETNHSVTIIAADLTNESDLARLEHVPRTDSSIDVLVNNAGNEGLRAESEPEAAAGTRRDRRSRTAGAAWCDPNRDVGERRHRYRQGSVRRDADGGRRNGRRRPRRTRRRRERHDYGAARSRGVGGLRSSAAGHASQAVAKHACAALPRGDREGGRSVMSCQEGRVTSCPCTSEGASNENGKSRGGPTESRP